MNDRELKQLAQWCFTCATGNPCKQSTIVLLETGNSLWFRVGLLYFLIVDHGEANKSFYTSNDAKEALLQF